MHLQMSVGIIGGQNNPAEGRPSLSSRSGFNPRDNINHPHRGDREDPEGLSKLRFSVGEAPKK